MAQYSLGMSLATAELPTGPAELHAFALACQSELKVAELSVQYKALEIEKLKLQIAKLRRMQFGRSSERIARQIEQLELRLEELETGEAESVAKAEAEADTAEPVAPIRERAKPKRQPLPDHLPRQEVVHQPADDGACKCPDCGEGMGKLGEDITEVLDYVPGHFQVIRHVAGRGACAHSRTRHAHGRRHPAQGDRLVSRLLFPRPQECELRSCPRLSCRLGSG
jgi:transposase